MNMFRFTHFKVLDKEDGSYRGPFSFEDLHGWDDGNVYVWDSEREEEFNLTENIHNIEFYTEPTLTKTKKGVNDEK